MVCIVDGKAVGRESLRDSSKVGRLTCTRRTVTATHGEKHDKRFWSTVSPFMSDKKFQNGSSIILEDNDETISDASRVSEIFNDFFVSVASEIGFEEDITSTKDVIDKYQSHPSVDKIKSYYKYDIRTFDFHTVDAGTVMSMIKNINPRKATGYDNIPGKLIKIAHQELSIPLCNLINKSMKLRCFPGIMKSAEVAPLYKKDNNLKRDNYRHVSILTVISKLFWIPRWLIIFMCYSINS